jgi:hypothetical protein
MEWRMRPGDVAIMPRVCLPSLFNPSKPIMRAFPFFLIGETVALKHFVNLNTSICDFQLLGLFEARYHQSRVTRDSTKDPMSDQYETHSFLRKLLFSMLSKLNETIHASQN